MDPATEMNQKELEAVREFRKRVTDLIPKFKSDFHRQDLGLLRFLRARDLNLNKSEEMLRKHLFWRSENRVDEIFKEKLPLHFYEDFPVKLCGKDKEGYLVAAAQIGKWDFRSAVEAGLKNEFILFVIQWFERLVDIFDQLSTKDRFYGQLCIIFDFEGFAYRQLASKGVITMLVELIQIFEANYPEVLRVIWIINAPAVFNILWGIIKPFLTERTTSKIRIHGSNRGKWRADIVSMVKEENIPSIYSGANTTCPDFNLKLNFDIKMLSPNFGEFQINDVKKVCVGARELYSVDISAKVGEQILWCFWTENCDITFGFNFEDDERIIGPLRVDSHLCNQKGSLTCAKSGLYTLVFDNTYSSFTAKPLRYIVWTRTLGD
ncbi:unnamed protein product [Allacma fusca]|uniref:CRAL-TRIO domain-containing protein n=1 Tax=Allacma fusca TaxID=39272 RepID=A0A8J2P0K2_9HEXA|nr:unnamed protein product [Allacma fusca]